jgi:hypothetical protein
MMDRATGRILPADQSVEDAQQEADDRTNRSTDETPGVEVRRVVGAPGERIAGSLRPPLADDAVEDTDRGAAPAVPVART